MDEPSTYPKNSLNLCSTTHYLCKYSFCLILDHSLKQKKTCRCVHVVNGFVDVGFSKDGTNYLFMKGGPEASPLPSLEREAL